MSGRTLVIDRSTARPSFALFEGESCCFSHSWSGEPAQAPAWMGDLEDILKGNGIEPSSIRSMICGLGPGSFSGIRACLSAMQGFALPDRIPVRGISSAEAIAYQNAGEEGEGVTVIGDARRSRLWLVSYRVFKEAGKVLLMDGGCPTQTAADFRLISGEELGDSLPKEGKVLSPDWERIGGLLLKQVPETRLIQGSVYPESISLGILAARQESACLADPLPIYLHPAVSTPPPFPKP